MGEEHDRVVTESILKSALTSALTDLGDRIEKRIAREGAATRAHFDIMVEKVNDSVSLVAEVNGHPATILDDREGRIQKIERKR